MRLQLQISDDKSQEAGYFLEAAEDVNVLASQDDGAPEVFGTSLKPHIRLSATGYERVIE